MLALEQVKPAGDVYTPEKRRLDAAGVSDTAVGIDLLGFSSVAVGN